MRKDASEITDTQRTKDQNRRLHPRVAQHDPLFDIGARQHGRPRLLKRQANLRRSVSVGIRLHYRDDGWRRRACPAGSA